MRTSVRRIIALGLVLVLAAGSALANGGGGNEVESSASVKNDGPENLALDLSSADEDSATPGVQVSPVPNGNVQVSVTASAEDGNGWQDLKEAKIRVFAPSGALFAGPVEATASGTGQGKKATYGATFSLAYHDAPGEYIVRLTVNDRKEATKSAEATFEYQELLAIALDSSSLSFGSGELGPGASTHGSASQVVVRNAGNVILDLSLSATPLATSDGAASIGPDRLKYSSDATMANERSLSAAGIIDADFDLAPGASATRSAYFDIHVPSGEEQYVPADTYTGRITIGGVVG